MIKAITLSEVLRLDADPVEALFLWVDKVLDIRNDGVGGASTSIDGFPLILSGNRICCTNIPHTTRLLASLDTPILLGVAKYEVCSGKYLGLLLFPQYQKEAEEISKAVAASWQN